MSKHEICEGTFIGIFYEFNVPKRIRCPKCGRRVKPSVVPTGKLVHGEIQEFEVSIPPHKVKGWYRKNKRTSRRVASNIRR